MLARQYMKYIVKNNQYTNEMIEAYNHLRRLNYYTYLAFPVF